jgi:hypothetical protein
MIERLKEYTHVFSRKRYYELAYSMRDSRFYDVTPYSLVQMADRSAHICEL